MTQYYCRVENGQIVDGPRSLPKNWGNISNLPALELAQLIARGWRPVVDDTPTYDPASQRLGAPSYAIEADRVVRTWAVENIPPETPEEVMMRTDYVSFTEFEYLVKKLIQKGVLSTADIPQAYLDRIAERDEARSQM